MAINYTVKQGDCISSIAFEHGFFPATIWDHPSNEQLKAKRRDPNVLMPGDVVFIPDKRLKELSEPTNQIHKFRHKGVPAKLTLRLLVDGEPRRSQPYVLVIDGKETTGATDSDGNVRLSIPPDAKHGKLRVGTGEDAMEYELGLGHLDPVEHVSGIQKRLRNLGFDCGPIDNTLNAATRSALAAYQAYAGLNPTGEPDEQTKSSLRQEHEGN